MTQEEQKQIKDLLDEKYESYILIGQEKEFEDTDLWLNAYSMGIRSLMEEAFKQYPPLKGIIKRMISDSDNEIDKLKDLLRKVDFYKLGRDTTKRMLTLSDEEIEKWAKEQSKIEPTGAEEFGRIMGDKWYREQLKQK